MSLPIEPYLAEIRRRVREEGNLLLSAAPGAGKTTCVPGALAQEFPHGKVIMVEPRRVAASAAALRISALLGEKVGQTVGYSVKNDHCFSDRTRIMTMTPGVLLRKIQEDPGLEDTAVVIFDEFHERSAECDLLFAFVLESCRGFREDLKVVVMSATLESSRAAGVLGCSAPLQVPGREFPVEQLWSDENVAGDNIPEEMAKAVLRMLPETEGNLLAFFPGIGEIRRCAALLEGNLGEKIILEELHGMLPLSDQSSVLAPALPGCRKVVLATNVAESSLTIDDVRCVIDCGFERVPRTDIRSGLTFLETVMISRASAAQRSGRAGRTAPGKALRLWTRSSHQGRKEFRAPEILDCDLSSLMLELALWGARPEDMTWLDAPPEKGCLESLRLLNLLGALDKEGRPTPLGREIARYPLHPRVGAIIAEGIRRNLTPLAIEIAALLENRTDTTFPDSADLELHIDHLRRHINSYRSCRMTMEQLRRITRTESAFQDTSCCGELLLAGFPDRAAKMRGKKRGVYTLYNGRGGKVDEKDPLGKSEFIVAAELGGKSSGDGTIFKGAAVAAAFLLDRFRSRITERRRCYFDESTSKLLCRKETLLGAMVLSETPAQPEPGELAQGIFDAALKRGIPLIPAGDKAGRALWERLRFAHRNDPETFPGWSERELADLSWSYFPELNALNRLERLEWSGVLRSLLDHALYEKLNALYPEKFRTPAGAEHRIDYSGEEPLLSVKLQEMLGVKLHPAVGSRKLPLRIELLSPAMRPVQTTSDLPGFWQGSYALVRKEMKARYPKHEWPENPAEAPPMLRSIKKDGAVSDKGR